MQTFTDLYRYRFILSNLVGKNLKVLYRSMSLGMLWTLLNPLVMIVTLTVIWVVVFKNDATFAPMCIVGLIPYNFTVYCMTGCVSSIPGNAPLVKKTPFPRQILPISIIATHLIHFLIQSVLILVLLLTFPLDGGHFGWHLLWILPVFALHLGLCIGIGLLVSSLNVVYRDVQYITDSLLTVMFWICPVIYSDKQLSTLEPWLYRLYYCNPLSGLLTAYRDVLFHGTTPSAWPTGMAAVGTLLIGYFGVRMFWKHERDFGDLI